MKKTIDIILVDDHALLRSGLKLLLHKKPACQVVAEATNGYEALQMFDKIKPDLLILDISMPQLDGIQVLTKIRAIDKNVKIIILSMHEDEDYITLAMEAGASGYIPKAAVDEELYTAIDTVMSGYIYLRPKEMSTVIRKIHSQSKEESMDPHIILSQREREVLNFLVIGFSLTEIARKLNISIKTVDTHKTRILNKLELTKKSELVKYAIKYSLINLDP